MSVPLVPTSTPEPATRSAVASDPSDSIELSSMESPSRSPHAPNPITPCFAQASGPIS